MRSHVQFQLAVHREPLAAHIAGVLLHTAGQMLFHVKVKFFFCLET